MSGTRLKAALLTVCIIACVAGLYSWLAGEKRQDDFASFDNVAASAKGRTGGAVASSSPQRAPLGKQHDEDGWLGLLASATEPGESWEEEVETAFVGADYRRLLSLYRSWIGQPDKLHARIEILNSLKGLDDRALAESLILEALSYEEGQDGFKLGTLAGLALGRTVWASDPQRAAAARQRLLGEDSPHVQMALMHGLIESSDVLGDDVVAGDLLALYLQSSRSSHSLLRQNITLNSLRLEAPEIAYDLASIAVLRPIASLRDEGEVSTGANALADLYERMPDRRDSIVSALVGVARRPEISLLTFGRVIELLKRVDPESLKHVKGRIGIPDPMADELLENLLREADAK